MIAKRKERAPTREPGKPVGPRSEAEVEYWLKQFGDDVPTQPDPNNPFPPGYGEDVEE